MTNDADDGEPDDADANAAETEYIVAVPPEVRDSLDWLTTDSDLTLPVSATAAADLFADNDHDQTAAWLRTHPNQHEAGIAHGGVDAFVADDSLDVTHTPPPDATEWPYAGRDDTPTDADDQRADNTTDADHDET